MMFFFVFNFISDLLYMSNVQLRLDEIWANDKAPLKCATSSTENEVQILPSILSQSLSIVTPERVTCEDVSEFEGIVKVGRDFEVVLEREADVIAEVEREAGGVVEIEREAGG